MEDEDPAAPPRRDTAAARHGLVPWLAAAGWLALGHTLILGAPGTPGAAGGLTLGDLGLATFAALGTLVPIALVAGLLRRRLPASTSESWFPLGCAAMVLAATLVDGALSPTTSFALRWSLIPLAMAAAVALVRSLDPLPTLLPRLGLGSLALGLVAGLTSLAMGGSAKSSRAAATQDGTTRDQAPVTAPADAPHVVLITIDTLRADRLGVYGRDPSLTPNLDTIGRDGIVFERTLAASPWTVPSIASLMTGKPTLEHGAGLPVSAGQTFLRTGLASDHVTLAEHFADAGYRTAAVVANAFLGPARGVDQGFEHFENPWLDHSRAGRWLTLPLPRLLARLVPAARWGDPRARGVVDRGLALLAQDDPRPLFLWLHLIDPHAPYQDDPDALALVDIVAELEAEPVPAEDGSVVGDRFVQAHRVRGGTLWLAPQDRARIESHYDRAVAYTDEHLGRLFSALGRSERSVVTAVTADHGEEFWDHGHFEHGHDYYREVTWVPALLWGPGRVPSGIVLDEPIGLVDLGPTLLDLAGLNPPAAPQWWEGWSLTRLWAPTPTSPEATTESGEATVAEPGADAATPPPFDLPPRFAGGNLYGYPAVALVDGPWRYILRANGHEELYLVAEDPAERRNLAFLQPEVAARYRALLEPRLAAHLDFGSPADETIDPAELEALRSLGYVQ